MTIPFTPELFELIRENAGGHRPLLFGNARIITGDSLIGDFDRGDVLLGGSRVRQPSQSCPFLATTRKQMCCNDSSMMPTPRTRSSSTVR